MVRFDEIISGSLEWTTTVLFRPFCPKKWLILGFVAFMAGALMSSNFNSSSSRDYHTKEAKAEQPSSQKSLDQSKTSVSPDAAEFNGTLKSYLQKLGDTNFALIVAGVATVLFLILLLFLWLSARFRFIFIEDVARNEASVILPFKTNRDIGNSFFKFNILFLLIWTIVFGLIVFGCIMALSKIGAFTQQTFPGFLKVFSVLLPFILLFVLLIIISVFIYIIIHDFVLVVMFKDRIKILAAVKKTLAILGMNKLNFLLYVLIKWGLAICSYLIYSVMYFVTFLGLLFPALTTASLLYFIYRIMPRDIQSAFMTIIVVLAIPVVLFLWYCFMCMSLPFAVFFRTFSIKFLGKLDNRYDLFRLG